MSDVSLWQDKHMMVRLKSGYWTCICGTVEASPDERDLMIHEIWAVREQNKALWGALSGLLNPLSRTRDIDHAREVLDACREVAS